MKIPFKPSLMRARHKKPRFIILHHTVCQYPQEAARVDSPKYQMKPLENGVLEQKTPDINFHYIVEKVVDDYTIHTARPFVYECDYPDIDIITNRLGIHIALLGNYNFTLPEKRLYEVMAYRLINPLLKAFALTPKMIRLHRDVSNSEDLSCPGDFVEMERIITEIRRFIVKS